MAGCGLVMGTAAVHSHTGTGIANSLVAGLAVSNFGTRLFENLTTMKQFSLFHEKDQPQQKRGGQIAGAKATNVIDLRLEELAFLKPSFATVHTYSEFSYCRFDCLGFGNHLFEILAWPSVFVYSMMLEKISRD